MTRKFWYILVGGILFAIGCSKSPEQSEETIRELNFSSQITDSADSATTNAPESRGTGGTLVTNGGLKNEGNAFVVYSTYSLAGYLHRLSITSRKQSRTRAGRGPTPRKRYGLTRQNTNFEHTIPLSRKSCPAVRIPTC